MLEAIADKIRITPPEGEFRLIGWDVPSSRTERPDDFFARILMLRNDRGDDPVVIVTLDCAMAIEKSVWVVDQDARPPKPKEFKATLPERTTEKWVAAAGLAKAKNLSVHATHTHYAPAISADEASKVRELIKKLAETARWTPVTVHGGVVSSVLPICRLTGLRYREIDHSLITLQFRGPDKTPVATLVNLGVHGTSMADPDWAIPSPDFIGVAMNELEKKQPGTWLFLQGWSGDVCPCNGEWEGAIRTRDKMKELADILGRETLSSVEASAIRGGDRLRVVEIRTQFKKRDVPGIDGDVTFRAIAIGSDVVIVAVSGEVFQDYGPILTTIPKKTDTFMPSCGLANGYSGYIPTRFGFDQPTGYEINTTPFTPEVEDEMRASFAKLFRELEA